ncbi:MlaD family protein [Emticicia sp. SJ17W-69]|uniref:MlaD family protein n=1 Tax=Emticicia sp. SJ17W-69 TaxID=3421657 RepID=UPI003EBDF105
MEKESGFTWKLGMFVTIGIVLFVVTIYLIGKQKNLFGSTFHLKSHFKTVSGLKVGNNVRFSGINVGTVDAIELITDTLVVVDLVLEKEVQPFIKTNAQVSISSDGLMGDKVLMISPGTPNHKSVKDNDILVSKKAIEMEDIMISMKKSLDNVGLISDDLAQFSHKVNNGNGALSKMISDEEFSSSLKNTLTNLQTSSNEFAKFTTKMNNGKGALSKMMNDEKFGRNLDSTMSNIQAGTKGLSETVEAAKSSFLLKGYFNKKEKAANLKRKKDSTSRVNKSQILPKQ